MDDGLKALLEYTTFHIGVYMTLGAAVAATEVAWKRSRILLPLSVLCLLIAGMAGGIVASNIPAASALKLGEFKGKYPSLLFNVKQCLFTNECFMHIEHGAFWCALGLLIATFIYHRYWVLASSDTSKELLDAGDSFFHALKMYGNRIDSLHKQQQAEADLMKSFESRLNSLEAAHAPENKAK